MQVDWTFFRIQKFISREQAGKSLRKFNDISTLDLLHENGKLIPRKNLR